MKPHSFEKRLLTVATACCVYVALPGCLTGQELSSTEQEIVRQVDANAADAIALLERVVNVNSGTFNPGGVREVGQIFRAELEGLGFATELIEMPESMGRGPHLFAEVQGGDGRTLLLIGHLDTVFEKDGTFQRYRSDGNIAWGPGVADMKSGDVSVILALKALSEAGVLDGLNVIVAFTGDEEEPGSPLSISRRDLENAAKRSDAALGFEGGVGGSNSVTVARRGFTDWVLRVTGRQGHSSRIFSDEYGFGAIFEASRILSSFYESLQGEQYLTFGAGIVVGGTEVSYDPGQASGTAFGKTNVIPREVTAAGDLRTITFEQRDRVKRRMREIATNGNLPGSSATIEFDDSYPPMAPTAGNLALAEVLDQAAQDLGLGPVVRVDPGERGAADISFAAAFTDALAGLGPHGWGAHTPDEQLDLGSLAISAKRAAVLIYRLGKMASGTG